MGKSRPDDNVFLRNAEKLDFQSIGGQTGLTYLIIIFCNSEVSEIKNLEKEVAEHTSDEKPNSSLQRKALPLPLSFS